METKIRDTYYVVRMDYYGKYVYLDEFGLMFDNPETEISYRESERAELLKCARKNRKNYPSFKIDTVKVTEIYKITKR